MLPLAGSVYQYALRVIFASTPDTIGIVFGNAAVSTASYHTYNGRAPLHLPFCRGAITGFIFRVGYFQGLMVQYTGNFFAKNIAGFACMGTWAIRLAPTRLTSRLQLRFPASQNLKHANELMPSLSAQLFWWQKKNRCVTALACCFAKLFNRSSFAKRRVRYS